jgi:hypothetical protein
VVQRQLVICFAQEHWAFPFLPPLRIDCLSTFLAETVIPMFVFLGRLRAFLSWYNPAANNTNSTIHCLTGTPLSIMALRCAGWSLVIRLRLGSSCAGGTCDFLCIFSAAAAAIAANSGSSVESLHHLFVCQSVEV